MNIYIVEVHAKARGYVEVEATNEEEALALVNGMELRDVVELENFESYNAEFFQET